MTGVCAFSSDGGGGGGDTVWGLGGFGAFIHIQGVLIMLFFVDRREVINDRPSAAYEMDSSGNLMGAGVERGGGDGGGEDLLKIGDEVLGYGRSGKHDKTFVPVI